MVITTLSIIGITLIIWSIKNILLCKQEYKLEICPICAGVLLTWVWLLIGIKLNLLPVGEYQTIIAILMGGTVVGMMYKLEKIVQQKFNLIWKTLFFISGFVAVSNLIFTDWVVFLTSIFLVAIITLIVRIKKDIREKNKSDQEKEIEEKMKNCC